MAPIDRSLRADRPLQTMPPTASPRRRTKADPSAPSRIISARSDSHSSLQDAIFRSAFVSDGHELRHRQMGELLLQPGTRPRETEERLTYLGRKSRIEVVGQA